MSRRAIERALAQRRLVRLRRGLYAQPDLAAEVRTAVMAGGAVSCVSALKVHGVWTLPSELHVRVAADAPRPAQGDAVIHRRGKSPRARAIDPPIVALAVALGCADDLAIVIMIDSALHHGLVSRADVNRLLRPTKRGRRLLSRVDAKAESGTETIARVRLRARRIRLRTQVVIADVGRVDLLIGERLVVELDGEQWHDRESTFESDRARDSALAVRGYIVLRYSYRRVVNDWDAVEREILAMVRGRRHVHPRGRSGPSRA